MSVRLSVCLFVRLSVCSLLEVPFKGLFAPTSRSRMSNIFRDSESLGKSNGKKWSHIQTFLFGSGLKSPRKKKFFFADFAGLFQWGGYITTWGGYIEIWGGYIGMMRVLGYSWSTLLWHRCYYPHRSRDALSPVCGIFFLQTGEAHQWRVCYQRGLPCLVNTLLEFKDWQWKNPAYGNQRISRPMRIVAAIPKQSWFERQN